ncbi:MAG: aminoglycoside phosphotransferase family protein [Myxococcales bacterium]|nr:aminoglycoside phosphotransferase family protein [Myxococcales bacterium]
MNDLQHITRRFPSLRTPNLAIIPMTGGLINDTYAVGDQWVLQRLHPIFGAEVNYDIATLTRRLAEQGVRVPRLVLAEDGAPFVKQADASGTNRETDGVWRVMTRLPGRTLHRLANPAQAASAGELVARFHAALSGIEHTFRFTRPGAHDTAAHMAFLTETLSAHPRHRLIEPVRQVAAEIAALWAAQPPTPALPLRIGHGDLKVSNLLFGETRALADVATAVLDLDTMAWMTMDAELGDALRSWCNTAAEDAPAPALDVGTFEMAIGGYAKGSQGALTSAEQQSVVAGLARITTELAARFAADALRETYFGWSQERAATRGEHNLIRAQNQAELARQILAARPQLEAIAVSAFRQAR